MKRKMRSSAGKSAYEIARDKAEAGEDDDDGKQMPWLDIDFSASHIGVSFVMLMMHEVTKALWLQVILLIALQYGSYYVAFELIDLLHGTGIDLLPCGILRNE